MQNQSESLEVSTNQDGPHERVAEYALKHSNTVWQSPISKHSQIAFEQCLLKIEEMQLPLMLDSGCGVGESTQRLALKHPDHLVIGVDKSEIRLSKLKALPANALLIRADLYDFWRLCLQKGLKFTQHTVLYPNPWPKSEHLKRRFHGHPLFAELLKLSPNLELRSNWKIYLDEFAIACKALGHNECTVQEFKPVHSDDCFTPFERKYFLSGHSLWKFTLNLTKCS